MSLKIIRSFFVLLLLFIGGCDMFRNTLGLPSQTEVFFPLAVGNKWNYSNLYNQDYTMTSTVFDEIRINNQLYYSYGRQPKSEFCDTLRIDHRGRVWKYYHGREAIWLDFTRKDQESYQFDLYGTRNAYTVTVNMRSCRTPAGEFDNCIEFFFDIPDFIDDEVIYVCAPGVGIVHSYGAWENWVLESYELKK